MMAIGILVVALTAPPAEPVCELTYVNSPNRNKTALRNETALSVSSDGHAIVELRGEIYEADFGPEVAAKLASRFARYRVFQASQQQFDRDLAEMARASGLHTPIPHADNCRIRIGRQSLQCRGSAILTTRITGLGQLAAFERLRVDLEQLRSIVILGGPREFASFLTAGKSALGADLPLSALVYADDFAGERVAHFRPAGELGPLLVVSSRDGERPVARVIEINAQ